MQSLLKQVRVKRNQKWPDKSGDITVGPRTTLLPSRLFFYNIDEMLWEPESSLYQLAHGKKLVLFYIISLQVSEPIDDIK